MRAAVIVLLAALTLAATACSKKYSTTYITQPPPTGYGSIWGVFYSISGPPIGVTIKTDPPTVTTALDNNGEFRINGVPAPLTYKVMTSGAPYLPETLLVPVSAGDAVGIGGYLRRTDTLSVAGLASVSSGAVDIAVRDSMAYLGTTDGLEIRDLKAGRFGRLLGRVIVGSYYSRTLALAGSYAYYSPYLPELDVVDVSNVASPQVVTRVAMAGQVHDAEVDGNVLIVAANDSVIVMSRANPASPVRVGAVAVALDGLGQGCYGIALDRLQKLAIVCSFNNGVEIVDYSNPAQPIYVNQLSTGINPWDATVDSVAKVATVAGDGGVLVLDYSDPLNVQILSQVNPGGNGGRDVWRTGNQILYASSFNGLFLLEGPLTGTPVVRDRLGYPVGGAPGGVTGLGRRVWVAANDRLLAVDLPAPLTAPPSARAGRAPAGHAPAAPGITRRGGAPGPVWLAHGGTRPRGR